MKKAHWFTLIETVIVVIIVWILLSITFSLSFDYVRTMEVKTDKEQMANVISDGFAIARTSNYYTLTRYETLNILLNRGGAVSEAQWWDFGVSPTIDIFALQNSELTFWTWVTSLSLDVTPYQIWCSAFVDWVASTSGFVTFALESTINDDRYCYRIDEDVCKLNQIQC